MQSANSLSQAGTLILFPYVFPAEPKEMKVLDQFCLVLKVLSQLIPVCLCNANISLINHINKTLCSALQEIKLFLRLTSNNQVNLRLGPKPSVDLMEHMQCLV